jgi:hypothetical protein
MVAMKRGGLKGKKKKKDRSEKPPYTSFLCKKKTTFPYIFQYGYLNKYYHHHFKHLHVNHKS